MPIYSYRCSENHTVDYMCKYEDRPNEIICKIHNVPALNVPAIPAFTPGRWGDTRGHYSSTLGTYVENSVERDKIMKKRGLVHLDDLGGDTYVDSYFDKQKAKNAATDKYLETYDTIYKETNDPVLSMEKAQEIAPTQETL